MRFRKVLVGALAAAVGAMCWSSVASAAVTDQQLTVSAWSNKQFKKQRGVIGTTVAVDTTYDAPPNVNFTPPANRTVIDFDRDFAFNPGKLATCSASSLGGATAAQAQAVCGRAKVGQGSAVIRTQLGGTIPAVVTAFNGVRQAGAPVVLLHVDAQGVPTKPILTGVLSGSPVPGFGQRLDVTIPVTPGTVITHFDTTINKITSKVTKKKIKQKGKKKKKGKKKFKKIKTFFASARCTDRSWLHQETTTFQDGSVRSDSSTPQPCVTKKAKKKKKKKKK